MVLGNEYIDGEEAAVTPGELTVLCFSHLRWNFVYQRPQHLLTRAASHAPVFFFEEPIVSDVPAPRLQVQRQAAGIEVLTPLLPSSCQGQDAIDAQRTLLDDFIAQRGLRGLVAWYYTPMALLFSDHLHPWITVYDCMDQLSAFQGAPAAMVEQEQRLFRMADVVFTGGMSLYESKRHQHHNVHAFPSSVDRAHFAKGRTALPEPEDQAHLPHPRIGFFGVLDERLDRDLIAKAAACEPSWQFILIGPVVKISEHDLPRAANIHYLGHKQYNELPGYLAHWDVAMLPFALNASTRYISPTKTPEYLSAGMPVVSTPIHDVVEPYGRLGLVRIAASADDFCTAIAESLRPQGDAWLITVDSFLAQTSWDQTFAAMWREVLRAREQPIKTSTKEVLANV